MKKLYLNNLGAFETGNLIEAKVTLSKGVNAFAGVVGPVNGVDTKGRSKVKSRVNGRKRESKGRWEV